MVRLPELVKTHSQFRVTPLLQMSNSEQSYLTESFSSVMTAEMSFLYGFVRTEKRFGVEVPFDGEARDRTDALFWANDFAISKEVVLIIHAATR